MSTTGGGAMAKVDINPIDLANMAPRCTAKAKSTGVRCCAPAVKGWRVCRVHGARGGHGSGPANPNYRHGGRTQEVIAIRAQVARLMRESREVEQLLR